MPQTRYIFIVLLLASIMLQTHPIFAQGCVQCRMAPSSNLEHGGTVARGINTGILYLMLIPYLLIMSIVAYVFRERLSRFFSRFRKSQITIK
jgi:hypothetical protein